MMYIPPSLQSKVFDETFRVLAPGGRLHLWDWELPTSLDPNKTHAAILLKISLPDSEITTGYGAPWPDIPLDLPYYRKLAKAAGFEVADERLDDTLFYLELIKPIELDK